jgi:small subunit ribosomal protein S14
MKYRLKTRLLKKDYLKRKWINSNTKQGIRFEKKEVIDNTLLKNKVLPLSIRSHISLMNNQDNEIISIKTKIRNRCIITGRSRGNIVKLAISRHIFRKWGEDGYIPGLTSHE